jgi:Autotransporter beta-domain
VVPGGAASLFTLTTPLPTVGFVLETFGQNPTNTSQWGIIQTVNPVFGDLGGVSALANTASAMLNDPASAFVTQKANPSAGETQIGLWMRGGAGGTNEDLTTTLSSGVFAASFGSRLRMSHQALQLGFDYGILNMGGNGWNLHFGLTGGKLDAGAKRTGSATNIQFDATFAGGYVFLTNGALTLDASVRKEWREFKIASAGLLAVSPQQADGDATVASILASYRIGGATGFQITPQVGYSYGDSDIDPFAIDAFTQFVPGGDKTKLGHAGVKIGYRGETGDLRFEPYVSVTALRNWSNREDAAVVFAGASTTNFDVDTAAFRKAIRYSLGLQGSDKSGKISAFVVGSLTDGNRVEGASVSVGARVNF